MRRVGIALVAAGTLTLLASSPASAAEGTVVVDNGNQYVNPSGCYALPVLPGAHGFVNATNRTLSVYAMGNCTGPVTANIPASLPGLAVGLSWYIP